MIRFLFHRNSLPLWWVLAGVALGFMIGRTQDPLDRAIRKAQNEARPQVSIVRTASGQTIEDVLNADASKRAEYARVISNNILGKEKAIDTLKKAQVYMDLAIQRNFIDNSLQKYLASLGEIQLQHGFLYQAVTNLEEAVTINPHDTRAVYNLAMSYLGLYQVLGNSSEKSLLADKLVAALNMALVGSPDNLDLLYGLALLYTDQASFARALPLFSKMLEIDSSNIDALMGVGRIYYEQKEYDKSRQVFEKAEALILNRRNQGGRFVGISPERRLETIRRNLEILRNTTGGR
ncbi:MAG: tetratricopeptide repeat protein [Brevinema sp.]